MKQLLENINSREVKQDIEILLEKAYIGICELRKQSLNKSLTIESIEEIEKLFIENLFNTDELNLPKYLQKYAQNLSLFWESYTFNYNNWGIRSQDKFNLFKSLKENDLVLNVHYSEKDCALILRRLENYWIASNQVYTKYEIDLINKNYIR